MINLYIDIETIPLQLEAREFMRPLPAEVKTGVLKDENKIAAKIAEAMAEFDSGVDAALDPLQSQVALIGFCMNDDDYQSIYGPSEAKMLTAFWKLVASMGEEGPTNFSIIGHNIRFDANRLIHRSWINGVPVPEWLIADLNTRSPRWWKDTMTRWQLGDYKSDYRKLKHLCGAFGITVKDSPVEAAKFREWWAKDQQACIEYNRQDVEACRALWKRIGG